MRRKWQLITGLVLAMVVTSGLYAFTYTATTATTDVTIAGEEIATAEPPAGVQPAWSSILTPPESFPLMGEVPAGDLFDIIPNSLYSGDLAVKVYLTNTGDLVKAYDYLNMKLYLEGSVEAGETPDYQLLTLQNGEANFTMQDISSIEGTWIQTSPSDFQGGTLNQVDATTSPGDVLLDIFSDSVTDSFDDESMIAVKSNLVVGGSQVKLTAGGAGSTETLRPNAVGDETEIAEQIPGGGEHWDKVDEEIADDTTYLRTDSYLFQEDLYNMPAHSTGSGGINYVKVYTVAMSTSTPQEGPTVYVQIKTNGVEDNGTAYMTTQSYTTFSHQWDTNPQTGQPWTWDEIDALQIGVGLKRPRGTGGPTGRWTHCTQVYVEVNYNAYDSPGTLTSVNLLSGETVISIDSFGYNASAIPSGTSLKVQFSQDSSTWYDSSGSLGQWDTLSEGSHSIDLSGLGWSGDNFYYKMEFTSDGTATPVLDEISVNFSTYYASGDLTSSAYDSGHDADWSTISFTIDEPSGTNIQFQIRTAATEGGLSSATWYGPTGAGDYYTTSGTDINSVHDGDRWIQYKAYFSGPGDDTPTLSDVTITYSAEAVSFTIEVTGGSYCLVSTDTSEWEAGWTVTPEFYCLIIQR